MCVNVLKFLIERDIYTSRKIISMKCKGDVGMSLHEKERNKKMPTPKHEITHNPIPTSFLLLTCCMFALGKANSTTS